MKQMTDQELVAEKGNTFFADVESYQNYFLACFESFQTGKRFWLEHDGLNRKKLKWAMNNLKLVTFNGNGYDLPMMKLALLKPAYSDHDLWKAGHSLIMRGLPPYMFMKEHGIDDRQAGFVDHVDVINVAFGKASLKLYAGRLHAPNMQDLPYDPESLLDAKQKEEVKAYCFNDVANTRLLFEFLESQLELRDQMSREYGMDLRSKSDAQIAEAVIVSEIRKRAGFKASRPDIPEGTGFRYKDPGFLEFQTPQLKQMHEAVLGLEFETTIGGKISFPQKLKKMKLKIGQSSYQMGIGGIHSNEQCRTCVSDCEAVYVDKDVASYYPSIILNQQLYPKHLGPVFLDIYKDFVDRRLKAKREKDKVTDASLKITINGSYGKLGSMWSALYSPDLLVQVTLTGQLSLLMLIESLELAGFSVVSGNTDGFVTRVPRARMEEYQSICQDWERKTRFVLEDTEYDALYSRDVNNYVALMKGKAKVKGCYRPVAIDKNPSGDIIGKAVVENLKNGTPVEDTIIACKDLRQFVFVQTVKGGALKDGVPVGKVVRWYQRKGDFTPLKYAKSGNRVPKSDGGCPVMRLPEEFPPDVDLDFYVREAKKSLRKDFSKVEQLSLFE